MTTVRLAVRDQEAFERVFDHHIQAFEASNPDVRVERASFTIEEQYGRFIERQDGLSGEFDLYLSVTDWIPQAVEEELFEDLDIFLEGEPPPDWPCGWSPSMLQLPQVAGHFYALPWHDGPEVFHYRADLFEDPSERAAFKTEHGCELAAPTTWDQFLEIAEFFTRPSEGLWGCCLAAAPDGHSNVYDFLLQLWNRGGELLSGKRAVFNTEPGWEGLQYLSDLIHKHRVASPDCLELNSVQSGNYYAAGNAAMMWNWCGFAATAELPPSEIIGKNRCAFLPSFRSGEAGVSLNIFWVLAMLSGSRHKEEAYRFMRFVCRPEMDKMTTMLGANGVRLSTWRDPEVQKAFPYYRIIEKVHERAKTLPAVSAYPLINEALNRAMRRTVHEKIPARESLDQAAEEVNRILGGLG